MEQAVVSEYKIVIKDGKIDEAALPSDVSIQDLTITFNNQKNKLFYIDLYVENQLEVAYRIGEGASVELIETRYGNDESLLKRQIQVDKNSTFAMLVLDETKGKLKVEDQVEVDAYAKVESAYAELSLSNVQGKYFYHLIGEEANVEIKMAALSSAKYDKSFEVTLLHSAPYTYGQMDNYGVTKDEGRLVFDGVGRIEKGMKQSSTHQTSKIIVFDPKCLAQANPYLYIDEYDVKASHAAGVGRMDEDHLFYLQSRGLTKAQAMRLITYGYLVPVVNVIDNENVKEAFNKTLEKRMGD